MHILQPCTLLAIVCACTPSAFADNPKPGPESNHQWPAAGGPDGSWTVTTPQYVPKSWSVTTGNNVAWQTSLPEGGQSNIAVWGPRLFLTINKPLPPGTTPTAAIGTDIVGYCLDSASGKILWQVDLPGAKPMQHTGLFSDNSSPTPVTDGKHVWFVNAGGLMGCWTVDGQAVWSRTFECRTRHNAKQCEPMLVGDWLLYVAMKDGLDPSRRPMKAGPFDRKSPAADWPWTYLRAFRADSGDYVWASEAGTSVHNTPRVGSVGGRPVVFHARGGGHNPPETPYGFSLTSLAGPHPGRSVWDTEMKGAVAYCVSHFDDRYAYCFDNTHLVLLDIKTGKHARSISLSDGVDVRRFDKHSGEYVLTENSTYPPTTSANRAGRKLKIHPTNQTNIVVDDYCLFMSHTGHCICRVNTQSGKVEYLQVPLQVTYTDGGERQFLWDKHIAADTLNARGIDVAPDKRAKGDGWGHVTSASPIAVNNLVYFSTMVGTVYVIDANAETFDARALVSVNDLGPAGKTWSLSSLSYAQGRFFHRGLKYVVGIR